MSKNKVEVIIGGTIYALQGEESPEHISKVASLIDKKLEQVQQGKPSGNLAKMYMLVAINVADDYLKLEQELNQYSKELEKCNAENLVLKDKLKELTLELAQVKTQVQVQHKSNKMRNDNRGR